MSRKRLGVDGRVLETQYKILHVSPEAHAAFKAESERTGIPVTKLMSIIAKERGLR